MRSLGCCLWILASVFAEDTALATSSEPTTPLLLAILANEDLKSEEVLGDEAAALAAIEDGADVNLRNTTFNDTPLLRASMMGQLGIVTLLCKHGADPNEKGPDDWTPLMWASRNTKHGTEADLVAVLLEAAADVSAQSGIGYTALHIASSHGNMATLMTLVEGEANVHARDNEGSTPLIVAAAAHSQSQLLRYLVRSGARVDDRDDVRGAPPTRPACILPRSAALADPPSLRVPSPRSLSLSLSLSAAAAWLHRAPLGRLPRARA